jgi:OOP family OmpA-OmpF porin
MNTIAIIGFILLCMLTIIFRADDIEADLQQRSSEALIEANISNIMVIIDGRDAILSGMVSSLDIKGKTEKLVSKVYGIRTVKNRIVLEKGDSENSTFFNLKFHPAFIDMVGLLPDSVSRIKLIKQVKHAFSDRNLKVNIAVDAGIGKSGTLGAVMAGLNSVLGQITVDEILYRQDTLLFSGSLQNNSLKKEYDEKIKAFNIPGVVTRSQFHISGMTPQAENLQYSMAALLIRHRIEFASNSAQIRSESETILDEISEMLLQYPSHRIKIAGHTDASGNPQSNLSLSLKRAEIVRSYLIARGVKSELLSAQGYGAKKPVADNATIEGRRQNRRVEFIVEKENMP